MTAAPEPRTRIPTLDILRGVAVMGILAMNIVGFAMPEPAYFNPRAYGGSDGADLVAWITAFILVDGKMRGLFSLLFGASMLLVIDRAEAKGEDPAVVHYRRILWLLVFGALHFYLIWGGDILLHYALVALAAFAFHDKSVRALAGWAAVLMIVNLAIWGGMSAMFLQASAAAAAPGADTAIVDRWRDMSSAFAPFSPAGLAAELALFRGPWLELVRHQVGENLIFPIFFLFIGGFETLMLMLLGMIGLRTGFLTGAWPDRRYAIIAAAGFGVGGAGFALLAWVIARSGFDTATVFAAGSGAATLFRLPMVIGYAALFILATRGGGWLIDRIAAAGRAAFTNYLGTSLAMTGIFCGWGLGYYGYLSRAEVYLLVPAAWALILLWSKPWLARFRYGPFEWLWRSLARGELQPMRK